MSVPTPILQYNLSDATMKGLLPAGYTPLTYIESTGTLYIDTGWTATYGMRATIIFRSGGNGIILSSHNSSGSSNASSNAYNRNEFYISSNVFRFNVNSTIATINHPHNIGDLYICEINSAKNLGTLYANINGLNYTITTPSETLTPNNTVCVGKSQYDNSKSYHKFYKILINNYQNLPVVDLRPAKRDSDGVVGMYDLVSRTFKTNSGSGTFIAGPELAVGKGGGKSLPEEYLLVEYLEGTGYLYIDTGMKASNMTKTELDFSLTLVNNNSNNLSAGWNGLICADSVSYKYDVYINPSKLFRNDLYGTMNNITSYTVPLNTKINVIKDGGKFYVDGTLLNTITDTNALTSSNNIFLMASNYTGYSAPTHHLIGKVYHCKITENGTIVRHFFPCYRKSDMKPGMYDVVNGVFYMNSGSGEFILGPSITNCYTYEPNANINHALIPSIYQQVEYLESTGTQRINTTYPYNSTNTTYRVLCKFLMVSAYSTYLGVYGAYVNEASNTFRLLRGGSNTAFLYGANSKAGGGGTGQVVNSIFNVFEVDHTYTQGILKNLTTGDSHTTTLGHTDGTDATSTFYLFDLSAGSTPCATKIYYFKLYDNNKLERYMVPCYRKSDNKPGMYDIIHNVFYINNGSGEFTLGPNVHGEGLYSNVNAVYDTNKGWVSGFTNTEKSNIVIPNLVLDMRNLTIVGWVKFDATQKYERFCDLQSAINGNLSGNGDGLLIARYSNNATWAVHTYSSGNETAMTNKGSIVNGTWYHIALTIANGTALTFYVNGLSISTVTRSTSMPSSSNLIYSWIGKSNWAADPCLTGQVQNFMIFDTALTAAQVKELYGK